MIVNNLSENTYGAEYAVVRKCGSQYWWYCYYKTFDRAQAAAEELGNGIVVPTKEIENL